MKKSSGRVEGLGAELLDTVTDLVDELETVKHLQRTSKFVLCIACLLTVVVAFLFFQVVCKIL